MFRAYQQLQVLTSRTKACSLFLWIALALVLGIIVFRLSKPTPKPEPDSQSKQCKIVKDSDSSAAALTARQLQEYLMYNKRRPMAAIPSDVPLVEHNFCIICIKRSDQVIWQSDYPECFYNPTFLNGDETKVYVKSKDNRYHTFSWTTATEMRRALKHLYPNIV